MIPCQHCDGEGSLYSSRYGGNDPDVYRIGTCDVCDGSGTQPCEGHHCNEPAVDINDDSEALCADCLAEWMVPQS